MSLRRAFIGCRIIETVENYARADEPLYTQPEIQLRGDEGYLDFDDRRFWDQVLSDPKSAWGKICVPQDVTVLSEWVARVPGLYWKPESEKLRQLSPEAVEFRSHAWITLKPWGKSKQVMGGIGTLRLPPGQDGYRLATLTTTYNASAGVPVLISPEVWEEHRLCEGTVLRAGCRWQPMASRWSSHFPSTKGIPRGYLVLDRSAEFIDVIDRNAPTQIHPFTIMEYRRGAVELFDYVYASADTGDPRYCQRLKRFFDSYKDRQDRYGRYLLAGDMVNPLWEAKFISPEDLRRADPSANSQLSILETRVNERHLGESTIEDLLKAFSSSCDAADDLKRLSDEIDIPPAIWFTGGSMTEVSSQLLDEAIRQKKVTALIEAFAMRYPNMV